MLDRQRGAAHVPVIVFLFTLILFFGALGFGYVVLEKNGKLEQDIQTANADQKVAEDQLFFYKHYVEDITAEIGEVGEWAGRAGFDYENYGNPAPLQNVALPSGVQDRIKAFAATAGVTQAKGLATFFGHIQGELEAKAGRIASLEGEKTSLQTNLGELQTALDTAKSARDSEVSSLNDQLSQKDVDYQAQLDEKTGQLTRQASAYRDLAAQKSSEKETARQREKELSGEVRIRDARIDAIAAKIKLINPPQAADAMVLEASQAAGRAWVNIGRRNMLAVGTTFRVTAPDSDQVKAYGTVSRVEADRAELRVTGLVDRFDPVVRGDEIHNDLYSPGVRRNVYLLGRFYLPYSKPMVKRILEDLGNTVSDKIGPNVDLVIVGEDEINEEGSGRTPIDQTEAYQQVLRLGIETATLNKVRDFLKLSE